ncbi:ribosome biogenesis GTP-binding protein YihA/YsxC [Flavobacteriales bacterium]|jgi:GTP-binding protein|nr:ribosome biogenesis GTP-binding protein YihA/YsxC [Flavobacteriales bacterium]MDB2675615.1 ribosome biogenesis GTP-binding protein YihA/YsxC [Flavobacteriales bacterium]
MQIKNAEFIISNTDIKKCPAPNLPEYAFIGRSNVGKSSLINMLTERKSLAKVSGRPGKTQLINHFLINKNWYLVDLPGYGYAGVSKTKRLEFSQFIKKYLLKRENLMCLCVLLDSRLKPQEIDIEFMQWLGENNIPFVICFTKQDKLSKTESAKNLANYKKEMLKSWEELPQIFLSSSVNKNGKDEILAFVEKTNALFQ